MVALSELNLGTLVASDSPGNLLDVQIFKPHSRPTDLKLLGGAQNSVFISLPGDSGECTNLRTLV